MSDFKTIDFQITGATAVITINRPQVMNALNALAVRELTTAFEQIKADEKIRGVILTGSGDRAFIAGADISEIAQSTPVEAERLARSGQSLMLAIETLGKPVVAAINGVALGGGCEAAMACTFRLSAPHAKYGQPEVKLGLIPGFGGSQRLPRLVGKGRAMHLILTGDPISAADAHRIGLVDEVVESGELLARAETILSSIYVNAPLAIGFAMEAINSGLESPLPEGLTLERSLFALCSATRDKAEGTSAFLDKRRPQFMGQ